MAFLWYMAAQTKGTALQAEKLGALSAEESSGAEREEASSHANIDKSRHASTQVVDELLRELARKDEEIMLLRRRLPHLAADDVE